MRRLTFMTIMLLLMFTLLTACSEKHYDESNISKLYDETWIIGKARDTIKEKYGKFNSEFISDNGENLAAYYVNYENKGFDPSYIHDTYFIVFNENDIAIGAYFSETSRGG